MSTTVLLRVYARPKKKKQKTNKKTLFSFFDKSLLAHFDVGALTRAVKIAHYLVGLMTYKN